MADPVSPPVPAASAESPAAAESRRRDEWFSATPDPWEQILLLQPGSDRTAATTVYRTIVNTEPKLWPGLEQKLIAALGRKELTEAGRLFVCRMLGLIGTAACLPAVAPLLERADTADQARLALDSIAVAPVDEAYRAALAKLDGAPLAGLIGSIALRGDAQARDAIAAIAADTKRGAAVRTAAERALARLAAVEVKS